MNTYKKMMMVVMILGIASPALANPGGEARKRTRRGNVQQRLKNQERRIERNEAKGKITADEAAQQRASVSKIAEERKADIEANGGKLTKEQRKGLNQELNKNSKAIHDAAHDAPAAPAAPAVPAVPSN